MKTVLDAAFKKYGKVLSGYPFDQLVDEINASKRVLIPEKGNSYQAITPFLEELPIFDWLKQNVYGNLPIQLGTCAGHNQELTAVEYHQGSETVIALTDCLLKLGQIFEIEGNIYNESNMEVFVLKKGQAVELYGTTLHYSPIEITSEGYATIVGLIRGTNVDHSYPIMKQSLLLAKNKFMLVHSSRKDKIAAGAIAGFIMER